MNEVDLIYENLADTLSSDSLQDASLVVGVAGSNYSDSDDLSGELVDSDFLSETESSLEEYLTYDEVVELLTSRDDTSSSSEELQLMEDISTRVNTLVQNSFLFSPTSTQASYFKGVMLGHPFDDYYAVQDSDYSYYLYFGKNLEAGSDCSRIHLYRQSANYSSYWYIDKSDSASCPSLDFSGLVISNLDPLCARFEGVDNVQKISLCGVAVLSILGFLLLSRILFRR